MIKTIRRPTQFDLPPLADTFINTPCDLISGITVRPAAGSILKIKTFAGILVDVIVLGCKEIGDGFLVEVKMTNSHDVSLLKKNGVPIKDGGFSQWIAFDFQIIK